MWSADFFADWRASCENARNGQPGVPPLLWAASVTCVGTECSVELLRYAGVDAVWAPGGEWHIWTGESIGHSPLRARYNAKPGFASLVLLPGRKTLDHGPIKYMTVSSVATQLQQNWLRCPRRPSTGHARDFFLRLSDLLAYDNTGTLLYYDWSNLASIGQASTKPGDLVVALCAALAHELRRSFKKQFPDAYTLPELMAPWPLQDVLTYAFWWTALAETALAAQRSLGAVLGDPVQVQLDVAFGYGWCTRAMLVRSAHMWLAVGDYAAAADAVLAHLCISAELAMDSIDIVLEEAQKK